MKTTINIPVVVKVLYVQMQSAITNLQLQLAGTPGEASRKWHDNAWDADDYGCFMCCCDSIDTCFSILRRLKIPAKYRDYKFELEATHWRDIA